MIIMYGYINNLYQVCGIYHSNELGLGQSFHTFLRREI